MSACQLTAALLQSSKKERSDKTPKTILALSIALDSIQAGWFAKCRVKCRRCSGLFRAAQPWHDKWHPNTSTWHCRADFGLMDSFTLVSFLAPVRISGDPEAPSSNLLVLSALNRKKETPAEVVSILNEILPPRIFEERGFKWRQEVSTKQVSFNRRAKLFRYEISFFSLYMHHTDSFDSLQSLNFFFCKIAFS